MVFEFKQGEQENRTTFKKDSHGSCGGWRTPTQEARNTFIREYQKTRSVKEAADVAGIGLYEAYSLASKIRRGTQ